MKRILAAMLAAAFALSMTACSGGQSSSGSAPAASSDGGSAPAATEEYIIGAAFPLTGKGATAGKTEVIGVTMAVNEINAAGGINGVPIKLLVEDTASDPKQAGDAVRKLASENALCIIGPHYSNEAEVTFPIGNEIGIVQVATACSKPGLSEANRPFAYRNVTTEDKISDKVLKAWVEAYDIKTVAIITDVKDSVSKSCGEEVFPGLFEALDVEVLTLDDPITYQTGDVDFSSQITKIKYMNPDGIALGSLAADAMNIIDEARKQGLEQMFVGAAPLLEGELEKKGGENAAGTFAGSVFWLHDPDPKVQEFVKNYREIAPTMYSGISADPLHYSVNAYDALKMAAEAIENSEIGNTEETLTEDRDKIRQYFSTLTSFPDGVASGGFEEGGCGIKTVKVLKIENNEWVEVPQQ